ncbi:MAG: VOC family protein [Candidatus Thermoplasmatota archaeon]|nr:VOC family protein [Candidatus Thermoplasmatota archaeon]
MSHSFYGIDHIQLAAPVGSEDIERKFFHDMLGMEEIDKPGNLKKRGGVWFRCGEHQIHIGIEQDFKPAKKAHPAIRVRDIESLKELLATNGIPVDEGEKLPGAKRFYVSDPFGNRIEFLEWTE